MKGQDFINDAYLESLVRDTKEDKAAIRAIFAKSKNKEPLTLEETAKLLAIESPEMEKELFETAHELKQSIYGNRIVLFAPLYIGNYCINDCKYCGFRKSLRTTIRKTLSDAELVQEVESLENLGHKRLILVYGESPLYSPEFIAHTVRKVYETKVGKGSIRRVNINAAPLDVEGYKIVKAAGIGTFQVFQETYHKETYKIYHPADTRKGDYLWRLTAMDRAFEGGIDDMGIGALFGLYDWRFEVLGLVAHAIHLKETFGVGPHTISFPRIQPANGLNREDLPYLVSDQHFKRLVAILRLAVPYTGLIMTARENEAVRNEVMEFGVSQIDSGTKLEIGGYQEKKSEQELNREQFQIGDTRDLDETIRWLMTRDFIPSFCTACYRLGRTGEHFMEYAIPGFIGNFCTPNAILTLAEYLEDYSSPETKAEGYKLIDRELAKMKDDERKAKVVERLGIIRGSDKRDLYF
ncbi:MAG: [Bacteroidales bacterium]|nr:[FeFe] hydrogenase H-cluster radical SAM maturase HydG [Bacteroidales bacterium]